MVSSIQKLILFGLAASALLNLFSIGLKASPQDATYLFRRPGELVRALLAMNVLMPLFALALNTIFDFIPAVKIALVALSVSPIPPPIPAKEMKSGGKASYVMGLQIAMGVLAIIFVPLAMAAIGHLRHGALQLSIAPVAKVVFISIVIPIVAGIFVRKLAPAFAERVAHTNDLNLGSWSRRVHRRRLDLGGACDVVAHRQWYRHRTRGICGRRPGSRSLPWRPRA